MTALSRAMDRVFSLALRALVQIYRIFLSPVIPGGCRFAPSCSQYALEALEKHGAIRGSLLTAGRVCRCHPLGGHGFDPVPPAAECGHNPANSQPIP